MPRHERYEIGEEIGQGDFAIVYRAKDTELGRDVAVKQIREQFLADPKQLERYWREAQLMATLQHPNIVTIYDLVRDRGWLIMELMQGNLKQLLGGRPIDLNDLRLALKYTLRALQFLADNGIVHGDVKPTNLLVDRSHHIKLGDFSIARRMSGDEGSVVKGTTKYMAPEVVSDQFGEVGPHSDLYSLGFSALELMCGEQFESLFPGLSMYGRDRQIAWMMWHAAPDRRLPEIQRVLEGVPDDLAHVIQKLTEKDPAKRYRTAAEALADLRGGRSDPGLGERRRAKEEAERQAREAAKAQRRKRLLAAAALGLSVVLSVGLALLPSGSPKPAPPAVAEQRPTGGVLSEIDLERNRLFLRDPEGGPAVGVAVQPGHDRIRLNGADIGLEDLERGDDLEIHYLTREDGVEFLEILASRPVAETRQGTLASVDPAGGWIDVQPAAGKGETPLRIYVPATALVTLNGQSEQNGGAVRLADLRPGDEAVVRYVQGEKGPTARAVEAKRRLTLEGRLVRIDPSRNRIAIRPDAGPEQTPMVLEVAPDCQLRLNQLDTIDGHVVTLSMLKGNDRVVVEYDTQVRRLDAHRDIVVAASVRSVDPDQGVFTADLENGASGVRFAAAETCQVTILSSGRPVSLAFLRPGDRVRITHDSPDLSNPRALAVAVDAQPDRRGWAAVAAVSQYDDQRIPPVGLAIEDAKLVEDVLLAEYRVAPDQLLALHDATKTRLEQELDLLLPRVDSGSQLILYYCGRGYADAAGEPFLATKGFDLDRIAATGVSLRWLVRRLESAPAQETLLLLDVGHGGVGRDGKARRNAAELVQALQESPDQAVSTSVTIIASCSPGERSLPAPDGKHTWFAAAAAAALRGEADANRDYRVDNNELFDYVNQRLSQAKGPRGETQTPVRFLPNPNPPRLTAEAIAAVESVLAYLARGRLDDAFETLYDKNRSLLADEPDLELAYGLANLKHNRTAAAQRAFENVLRRHPECLLPYHALAWQDFLRGDLEQGVEKLAEMVRSLPPFDSQRPPTAYESHLLEFAGRLRQFALWAAESRLTLEQVKLLDDAVLARDKKSQELYKAGVDAVSQLIAAIDKKLKKPSSLSERNRLERDRQRLTYYTRFDFGAAEAYLRERLKR